MKGFGTILSAKTALILVQDFSLSLSSIRSFGLPRGIVQMEREDTKRAAIEAVMQKQN